MKKIHLSILLLLCVLCASQAQAASTINGMLVDARDTTALIAATVKLLKAGRDSTYVDGVVTDTKGIFNLKGVKPGHYIIKCSYLGYDNATRRVTVGTDGRDVNVGLIALDMSGKMLDEVVVQGVKTPITVKEDTIEYNADTYKTQANAVVEDVLKRLPGVEVGSDGKITANGKQVTKILIDGKEFFSDDPTVASKNIPANMVDKLQVIDRKSDLARLTGVDDGDDEVVAGRLVDGVDQLVLVGKVVVEGTLRHAAARGDLAHLKVGVAALDHELTCRRSRDDHGRTDGTGKPERLMQEQRRAQHRDHRLEIAQQRNLLDRQLAHRPEVEDVGDARLHEAEQRKQQPRAGVHPGKQKGATVDHQRIRQNQRGRGPQLDHDLVVGTHRTHALVADDDAHEGERRQKPQHHPGEVDLPRKRPAQV